MKRKIAIAVGALSLTTAGIVGLAPAASAERSVRAGTLYLYQHDNFGGGSYGFTATDKDLSNNYWNHETSAGSVNNGASSMKNKSDRVVYLYQNGGSSCGGDRYTADKKSEDKDLSSNSSNPEFDNKASCVVFN